MLDLNDLNHEQLLAVADDSQRLLVLAGAGSGKTKTLLQKIAYLIEKRKVPASKILAITFTRNACDEMVDRLIAQQPGCEGHLGEISDRHLKIPEKRTLRNKRKKESAILSGLRIETFHALCYQLLKKGITPDFDNKFKLLTNEKPDPEFEPFSASKKKNDLIRDALKVLSQNTDYRLRFKRYLIDYFIDRIDRNEYKSAEQRADFRYTTLNGTRVRSKSEAFIADWLYRHQIEFEYERRVHIEGRDYYPDFYLPASELYLEHTSDLSSQEAQKRVVYHWAGMRCVYTTEEMMRDHRVIDRYLDETLRDRLNAHFEPVQISMDQEFKPYPRELKDLLRLMETTFDKIKSFGLTVEEMRARTQNEPHDRTRSFYELALPLFEETERQMKDHSYLDFNDLLIYTLQRLDADPSWTEHLSLGIEYLLIDEFQDVNHLQIRLVQKLLGTKTHLFCVGDDWQSIYGFRGSEMDYIVRFEEHFPPAKVISLVKNYRSHVPIVEASSEVMKRNKNQVQKHIESAMGPGEKITIHLGPNQEELTLFAASEIENLKASGYRDEDILFLYRRTMHFDPYYQFFRTNKIKVNAKTIHASKGLEAKVVFLVGLNNGRYGFPDDWLGDRIHWLIHPKNPIELLEEERRLFYVALTRARERVYLLGDESQPSSFLEELPAEYIRRTGY